MSRLAVRQDFPLIVFLCGAAGFTWMVQNDPFFWDTIQLASKHAHFFYENGRAWKVLPPEIDSGHPPVFGYYLAVLWTFFGKTLPVSHWAMVPFLLAIIVSLYRLGRTLGGRSWAYWLLPLVLLDPVFLGQSALVSPDVALAAFFLCSLDGLLNRKTWLVIFGTTGLCIISMRGMMCAGGLFIWLFVSDRKWFFRNAWLSFTPGFMLAGAFLHWHFRETGWIGYHAGSPWAPAFRPAGPLEMIRNIAIIGWRWLDFGRLGEWMAAGILLWLGWKNEVGKNKFPVEKRLLWLFVVLVGLLSISAVRYNNLSAHRYFLPLFMILHFLVFQWIVKSSLLRVASKNLVLTVVCIILAAGSFQVYPHGISMDWDSTPAHLPYHEVRTSAIAFLKQEHIALSEVGSAFPNVNTEEAVSLDGNFDAFTAIDTINNRYVMISNVFNDVSKEDREYFMRSWRLIWQQQRGRVWAEIYQKEEK